MITSTAYDDGVVEVVVDHPPVNALPVQGWFDLAEAIMTAGRNPDTRVVVLRAEGRGFNAGVDIKEFQKDSSFNALVGANRGCHAAFGACYECPVPVITAVQGFCLGGGIGLALTHAMSDFRYREVVTCLILIVLVLVVIDRLSAYLRSKVI